ncbi:P1 family peptidase [Natribacillus halophilus]|uniref:D-aminopeptidase n=1 Tax=Natribacillus halophilus TaxID=549003 RepID=A0A1G8KKF6_9BACI|nr:P1 family peptidase [Natribacillus halophilus]SDI43885.1 D-aminopeptidase [Natribacillus halophilus]
MTKANALTDVPGVKVGHKTLIEGSSVRTGVTAILPHGGNLFQEKVIGAAHVINGFGKTTGLVQLEELGVIESPIMLTNTFSVPAVTEGVLQHLFSRNEDIGVETGTVNTIVGECNDGYLNDIRGLRVRADDAIDAIESAGTDVAEGSVGAGTGMSCFGYKGGIGTSSRVVGDYTVGVLVLSNFGQKEDLLGGDESKGEEPDGSIMMIVGTDAPLNERQLKRVARRTTFGLARTGSYAAYGSGDIAIAFSTAHSIPHHCEQPLQRFEFVREASITPLFEATVEATEEAIWNSLAMAGDMIGRNGHERKALDLERLIRRWG